MRQAILSSGPAFGTPNSRPHASASELVAGTSEAEIGEAGAQPGLPSARPEKSPVDTVGTKVVVIELAGATVLGVDGATAVPVGDAPSPSPSLHDAAPTTTTAMSGTSHLRRRATGTLTRRAGGQRRRARRTSAIDHAWNGQPDGRCGATPSAVSEIDPRPPSRRCSSSAPPSAPSIATPARTAASTYGPTSHGHTVPWWYARSRSADVPLS